MTKQSAGVRERLEELRMPYIDRFFVKYLINARDVVYTNGELAISKHIRKQVVKKG